MRKHGKPVPGLEGHRHTGLPFICESIDLVVLRMDLSPTRPERCSDVQTTMHVCQAGRGDPRKRNPHVVNGEGNDRLLGNSCPRLQFPAMSASPLAEWYHVKSHVRYLGLSGRDHHGMAVCGQSNKRIIGPWSEVESIVRPLLLEPNFEVAIRDALPTLTCTVGRATHPDVPSQRLPLNARFEISSPHSLIFVIEPAFAHVHFPEQHVAFSSSSGAGLYSACKHDAD